MGNAQRRLEIVDLLADEERFAFTTVGRAWGGDEPVAPLRFLVDTSVFARLGKPAVAAAPPHPCARTSGEARSVGRVEPLS